MATVTGFTAERMLAIENGTVVDGDVVGTDLILITRGGTQINAGSVQGPQGIQGIQGNPGVDGATIPTGQLANYPKAPVPAGWLICDGTIYNIVDYPALGAYLANTFGGNGTTTFAVPNYKGRVQVNVDGAQPEFTPVGKIGGEKAHILTVAEMPVHAHGHSLAAPQHVHDVNHYHTTADGGEFGTTRTGEGLYAGGIGGSHDTTTAWSSHPTSGGANALGLTGGINNNGSGAAHNLLSPYVVVLTAIKT
jgi:microcystin-dependent protein